VAREKDMKDLRIFIFVLCFIILSTSAFADTLYLKDGRVYRGKYTKGDKHGVQFKVDDRLMGFPIDAVSFISAGEEALNDREGDGRGKGVLKGIVTYNQNIESRVNSNPQPDFGAKVYACKLRVDNILIFYQTDELLQTIEIDDFIKDYMRYSWAKWSRKLLSRQNPKQDDLIAFLSQKQSQLKKLGADTEKGWEAVRNRGRAVFGKLDRGEVPSRIALAERDGTFSFQLPAGYYFLLAQSEKNRLQDAYATVKISDGKAAQISLDITFLN
jgi:hypothetical protein